MRQRGMPNKLLHKATLRVRNFSTVAFPGFAKDDAQSIIPQASLERTFLLRRIYFYI